MAAKGSFRKSYRAGMNNSTMGMGAGGGLYDRAHLENNGWVDILMGLNMSKMPWDFLESNGLLQKKEQYLLEKQYKLKNGLFQKS